MAVAKKKNLEKTAIKSKKTKVVNKKVSEKAEEAPKAKFSLIRRVQKRNGAIVSFDLDKVTNAIYKAMINSEEGSREEAEIVATKVYSELVKINKTFKNFMPTVEGIQDLVEQQLILSNYVKTSKHYILYREERARIRATRMVEIPEKVKQLVADSRKYFRTGLGEFMYYRTYSRWLEEEQRRETWIETVDRYVAFMKENMGDKLKDSEYAEVREAILKQEALPSMRLLQFAGGAARRTNVTCYNCSFIAPESFQDLAEIIYISMCGTGVGFSVESQNVEKFPQIKIQNGKKVPTFVVPDTREGWADSLALGMKTWADGNDIDFDFSQLRPAGARLKTTGGKSSGPEPLIGLLAFVKEKMLARQGKRLRNIDVHDIICKIGECVVSGGVRRTALISLSDLDDAEIRDAKMGAFYNTEPQRMLSNNSAVYTQKPTATEFMEEWVALMKSGSGERGIFNKGSLAKTLPERRIKVLKEYGDRYFDATGDTIVGPIGTNPCGEIILQSKQFCNLTNVVARPGDTLKNLLRKVRIATIIGTYQSALTKFEYLSKEWKENCDKERLLGIGLAGQYDSEIAREPKILEAMKKESIRVNKLYAKRFGINESTAITCVKPDGNSSQTFDYSSGMHPRFAEYYIRRIRISATDSLFKMLKDQGIPYHPEIGQSMENANTYVLEFPVKSPSGSIFKNDLTAIEQLEHWKIVKTHFTEHNPSVTISIGEDEWIEVANWLYKNWDIVGGLSFLPREKHVYKLAPYEEINEAQYLELAKKFEGIDYSKIMSYEKTDETDVKKELACAGGACEVEDIPVETVKVKVKKVSK